MIPIVKKNKYCKKYKINQVKKNIFCTLFLRFFHTFLVEDVLRRFRVVDPDFALFIDMERFSEAISKSLFPGL